MASWCATKSKSIWKAPEPYGIAEVVSPRAETYSGTCHQWFSAGESAIRTLPTTCVHRCSVSRVGSHASSSSAGHALVSGDSAIVIEQRLQQGDGEAEGASRLRRTTRAASGRRRHLAQEGGNLAVEVLGRVEDHGVGAVLQLDAAAAGKRPGQLV